MRQDDPHKILADQAKTIVELKRAIIMLERKLLLTTKRADRAYENARVNSIQITKLNSFMDNLSRNR
jgi:hypothetical protein